jgi:hypothetical protein
MSKFAEVKIGMGTFRTVSDRGNIPQGLFSGQRFVAKKDLQYADQTFLKGAGMEFVGYAVVEVPSSDDDYAYYLQRFMVFRFDGEVQNRQADADDIQNV